MKHIVSTYCGFCGYTVAFLGQVSQIKQKKETLNKQLLVTLYYYLNYAAKCTAYGHLTTHMCL